MKRKNSIDGISIRNFVCNYLGTEHECSKLKHQGLKSFNNPYVVGVSNDFALKNPDCVIRQELLMVIDYYGNLGTYINPINIQKLIEIEIAKEKLKLLEHINCHNFEEAAYLYGICDNLIKNINYLEVLYSGTYELLYLLGKFKLLKNIKKHAKGEAKRTLIFTNMKSSISSEAQVSSYEYDNLEVEKEIIEEDYQGNIDNDENIQITEKVNRQKCLDYKPR